MDCLRRAARPRILNRSRKVSGMKETRPSDTIYRKLRRHLDRMPVGYPKTLSGVELDILKKLFTPETAEVALHMTWKFQSAAQIFAALPEELSARIGSEDTLRAMLDAMAGGKAILRRTKESTYALVPFVVGMYELQVNSITAEFYDRSVLPYFKAGFGLEYVSSTLPQNRVIPVNESIAVENRVADWDFLDSIITNTKGEIAVIECICRKVTDLKSQPCRATERRELCMVFNDYADTVIREGWGRKISKEEAFAIALENRKDGLILQPSNEKDPQVVCACCGCCCGLLGLYTFFKRPADFISSNYEVRVGEGCRGCGLCEKFCQMKAITVTDKKPVVDTARCAGCGVCAFKCPAGTLSLVKKAETSEPPMNTEELFERIAKRKAGVFRKISVGLKGILGIPQRY